MTPAAGPEPKPEPGPQPEPGPEPGPARDPGLQPERTRLAWRRTTLACTVVAALGARQAVRGGGTAGAVGLAFTLLAWLGFLWVSHLRARVLRAGPRPPVLAVRGALAAVGCTVALAASAVAIVR
ncbi:DUF202 domain-containing protein [Streptomyces sp. NPDC004726]